MAAINIRLGRSRHILLSLTIILYLLFSPSLYHHLFILVGKPVEGWDTPPQEYGAIQYNTDRLVNWSNDSIAYKEGETYALMGWAFLNKNPRMQKSDFDRFVVIYDTTHAYVFPMQTHLRPDVEEFYKNLGLSDLASSGFVAVISRNSLPAGEYEIGILLRNSQDSISYYTRTNRVLVRTPNHLLVRPSQ